MPAFFAVGLDRIAISFSRVSTIDQDTRSFHLLQNLLSTNFAEIRSDFPDPDFSDRFRKSAKRASSAGTFSLDPNGPDRLFRAL